jgi:hypothetical protein
MNMRMFQQTPYEKVPVSRPEADFGTGGPADVSLPQWASPIGPAPLVDVADLKPITGTTPRGRSRCRRHRRADAADGQPVP